MISYKIISKYGIPLIVSGFESGNIMIVSFSNNYLSLKTFSFGVKEQNSFESVLYFYLIMLVNYLNREESLEELS